jgi:hypothetical protein
LHNYTIIEKDEDQNIIAVENLMHFLLKKEYKKSLEKAFNKKMNFYNSPNSLINLMSTLDGANFVNEYFSNIRTTLRVAILRKLDLSDYIKMMGMPNFVSAKFFDLCIQEDGGLTYPDKRIASIWSHKRSVCMIKDYEDLH